MTVKYSIIKTFTEYLPEKKKNPEFLEKFQNIVGMEVNKINTIIKKLLDFSKPEELNLKNINLTGRVSDNKLMEYINNSDVCLSTFGSGIKPDSTIQNKIYETLDHLSKNLK